MFDLGFSELVVIAIVALVVLGPERLPKATRFVGVWVRRARSQWSSVKDELERDMASEDLRRQLNEARSAFNDTRESIRESADEARTEFEQMRAAVAPEIEPASAYEAPQDDEQMDGRLESANLPMDDEQMDQPYPDTGSEEADPGDAAAEPSHHAGGIDPLDADAEPDADRARRDHQYDTALPQRSDANAAGHNPGRDDEDPRH